MPLFNCYIGLGVYVASVVEEAEIPKINKEKNRQNGWNHYLCALHIIFVHCAFNRLFLKLSSAEKISNSSAARGLKTREKYAGQLINNIGLTIAGV